MKVLFVSGSGGHSAQLSILLEKLGERYKSEILLEKNDRLSIEKFSAKYETYKVIPIRGKKENKIITFFRIVQNILQSIRILSKSKPNYIITTGPGVGISICILGKMFGVKIIVIESWSRTKTKSICGKTLYPFSDLFFVQWSEMKKLYPKARFAGRFA